MPPAIPANDAARMNAREMFGLSLMDQHPRVGSMSVAWDIAAQCLANGDAAGFDAAMKIFRALEKAA
jgi:hypothetical protein